MKTFNIGIKGVIRIDDKVLILRSASGYWEMPGGRMEEGEDIPDTLRRELSEELPNIRDVGIHKAPLAAFMINKEYKPGMGLMLIFLQVTASFDGNPLISDEHTEYRWVMQDEARQLIEDASLEAIEKVFQD